MPYFFCYVENENQNLPNRKPELWIEQIWFVFISSLIRIQHKWFSFRRETVLSFIDEDKAFVC